MWPLLRGSEETLVQSKTGVACMLECLRKEEESGSTDLGVKSDLKKNVGGLKRGVQKLNEKARGFANKLVEKVEA